MVYATSEDVTEYIGYEAPEGTDRLIKRATELIDYATMQRIDTNNTNHLEAAKNAVCSQLEYWFSLGEEYSILGSNGTIKNDDAALKIEQLAPRTRIHLNKYGLLYRGV